MVTQAEPIRGKIAKILNSREVALNIGEENGVKVGMVFEILFPSADEIVDPDTGASLGSVAQAKTRVKVERAYDRFAIAATYRSKEVNIGGKGLLGFGFSPPKWEIQYETLKENGSFEAASEKLDANRSFVDIGDPVVQVIGNR